MYNLVEVEKLGKPAVALCNVGFVQDAVASAAVRGVPGLRIVPEEIPSECTSREEIHSGVDRVFDQILRALLDPPTDRESSPEAQGLQEEGVEGVVYRGTLEEVNRYFYRMGWTDGLPIVPPTPRAVEEMLRGTDLEPDHVVAHLPPRMGRATVEKIAVNAVMAGALPTHLPVVIAAVEALLDPRTWFGTYQVSTGSWAPFVVVNGPVRRDVGLNCSSGALSPGNMANAAIGRALSLVIRNIGGARPGIEDMGVLGNPGKWSMVAGEWEELSPWPPLHVDEGLSPERSAVSVIFVNTFVQVLGYGSEPEDLVRSLTYNIPPTKKDATAALLLPPHLARILAQAGWQKQDVVDFVWRYTQVPACQHPDWVRARRLGERHTRIGAVDPHVAVQVLGRKEVIRVVVVGGPGNVMGIVLGGGIMPAQWVTRQVQLPRTWGRLVTRYRGVVPRVR
ncbi:MAG: hypothetical protein QN134_09430 [Armatimonadota bacterium]|nr:hypothetical protein [Armatimonadota bacterium]